MDRKNIQKQTLSQRFRGNRNSKSKTNNYTPEAIARLINNHPELRLNDPCCARMIEIAVADSEDEDIQELLQYIIDQQAAEYIDSGDAFWSNYPPVGSIEYSPDFITVGYMRNSIAVGLELNHFDRSVIISGPIGYGKTVLLSHMISSGLLLSKTRVILFARKKEIRHFCTIPEISDLVITFLLEDVAFSFFQPPPGVTEMAWNNDLSRTIGQTYGIFTAHRIMNDVGAGLLKNHPVNKYPTLRQLVEVLENYKPRDYMRDAQLKTSIVSCCKDLLLCTGNIWDYSSSNFLEMLFTTPGLAIIEAPSLPQSHLTFIATYMMRYLYLWRNNLV